jgi:hypothetical protein
MRDAIQRRDAESAEVSAENTAPKIDELDVILSRGCPVCALHKGYGYHFCRRCTAALPGGVQFDLRDGVAGAFERALEILRG